MYDDFDTQVQIDELASLYDIDLWDCHGNYERYSLETKITNTNYLAH